MREEAIASGWDRIDCPVCSHSQFRPLFQKQAQQFVECEHCGLVLINPRPPYEQIVRIYEADYSARYTHKRERKLWRAARRVRQMGRYAEKGRWLDVGCSAGFILAAAKDAGYEPYGSDVDPTGLSYAREHFGIETLHTGFFEDAGYASGFFDVITLYDVLEHVWTLDKTVRALKRLLAPAGIVEIWTPDLGHWRRPRVLSEWNAVMPYKHLYYFNFRTLSQLFADRGLKVVHKRFSLKPGLRVYFSHS